LDTLKTISIFCFLFVSILQGQREYKDYKTITWKSQERLAWSDFKGEIPLNNRAAAVTASGITYRFSTSSTRDVFEVDFKIDTHFYPNKSWYQPELCDDIILSHEQLHFDISELYARKLRNTLENSSFTRSNVKAKVKEIYRKNNEELNDFQSHYDSETNFSRDREQQILWNKKIATLLNK